MARGIRGVKKPHPLGSVPSRSGASQLLAESGVASVTLPGVKISALPAAGGATISDQLEANQSGTSRSITVAQVSAAVQSTLPPVDWSAITGKPTSMPPNGPAGGDLSATYPNPLIKPSVTNGQVLTTVGGVSAWAAPTGGAPSGAAGGDLTGTYPNPTLNPEVIDDRVAALLVAGTNVTLNYNDAANSLTINSTASGGAATLAAGAVGYGSAGNVLTGVLADFAWDATNKRLGVGTSTPGALAHFNSATAGTKALIVRGTTTSASQDYFDVVLTDPTGGGGSAMRVMGGATGINPLFQVDRAGDTQVSGWLRVLSTSGLVTNGADYFGAMLGNGAGGNLGTFAGLGAPTFSTFGSYGSLYLNGSSPGLPYYNNNGTTGWDRLVGETSTQTLTGKTIRAGYATGVPITTSGTAVTPAVQVASTAIDGYSALRYGGGNGATFTFAKSGSTTLGTQALVSLGTSAGKISFNGSNGTNFIEAAYIEGAIDSAGTPGVASMPGRVSIAVSPDGSATPAEALRIDSFKSVFLYGQLNGTTATFTGTVMAPGAQIQMVSVETGALATGSTVIPGDDTIPQITEGDQYMSLAITPKSATSKLVIEVVWNGAVNATPGQMIAALFQDSTANALAAITMNPPAVNSLVSIKFTHAMISGTTSATTFRVRAGASVAGPTTFNGSNGARLMGGVMASSIVIREIAP